MQRYLVALALCAVAIPAAALAQSAPNAAPHPRPSLSPEMRSALDALRKAKRDEVYAKLSSDHRARVEAIVGRVNSGSLTDVRDAARQIDSVLSYDEGRAIERSGGMHEQGMREHGGPGMGGPGSMHGDWHGAPPPNGAAPAPGANGAPMRTAMGGPGMGGPGMMGRHHHGMHGRDAGMAIIGLSVDEQKLHDLWKAQAPRPRPTA
jgi:hypothetical protein